MQDDFPLLVLFKKSLLQYSIRSNRKIYCRLKKMIMHFYSQMIDENTR